MLRTLKSLIVLILLAGWALAGSALHVVRWPGAEVWIGIVPKDRLGVKDTYVDVRNWTAQDIYDHPDLVKRLIHAGKSGWLTHIVSDEDLPAVLERGPAATQPE